MYNRTASGQITVAGEKEKSVCIYQDGAYEIVDGGEGICAAGADRDGR